MCLRLTRRLLLLLCMLNCLSLLLLGVLRWAPLLLTLLVLYLLLMLLMLLVWTLGADVTEMVACVAANTLSRPALLQTCIAMRVRKLRLNSVHSQAARHASC